MQHNWIHERCPSPSESARAQACSRQSVLTKPAGSLGTLENIAIDFAAWQGHEMPTLEKICIRIFAADHGVCAQGVSAFPQAVTAQMVQNFLSGGAAISVLAKHLNADFSVTNLGTVAEVGVNSTQLVNAPVANGTQDFSTNQAMTSEQLNQALKLGKESVQEAHLFIGGEMGIGNTTSASAIYAQLLSKPAAETVGPGTGINAEQQQHKAAIVKEALELHQDELTSPLAVLKILGGFEIAALTGAYISAAQRGIPILVDGFICTAAALLAVKINPSTRAWMMFAHQSAEPAHKSALQALQASPFLSLGMRLGEGSGAAIAVPIIQSALRLHGEMATFADAGVSKKDA